MSMTTSSMPELRRRSIRAFSASKNGDSKLTPSDLDALFEQQPRGEDAVESAGEKCQSLHCSSVTAFDRATEIGWRECVGIEPTPDGVSRPDIRV